MTTETRTDLQDLYDTTAREFARRLLERFDGNVHSVILYGSVARGTSHKDSDIDLVVLRSDGRPDRDEMVEISEAIDFDNNFQTFIIATGMTPHRLAELARGGFPIASAILEEGVVLYDDGTFQRICQNAPREG